MGCFLVVGERGGVGVFGFVEHLVREPGVPSEGGDDFVLFAL